MRFQIDYKPASKQQQILEQSQPGSMAFIRATVALRDLAFAGDKTAKEILRNFNL